MYLISISGNKIPLIKAYLDNRADIHENIFNNFAYLWQTSKFEHHSKIPTAPETSTYT